MKSLGWAPCIGVLAPNTIRASSQLGAALGRGYTLANYTAGLLTCRDLSYQRLAPFLLQPPP